MKSKIYISYKDGILDPQGTVTNKALNSIGMKNIDSISIGKFITEENIKYLINSIEKIQTPIKEKEHV